ncbi:GNAT family N-acetyltransferase [Falsiroseomonas sp. HW251]|uniref:GNAT family N-acetyltransferase n=1 Tax=Falsiroseomonas sp. HW251 TaxID=3390998 RepID=UPI003D323B4F
MEASKNGTFLLSRDYMDYHAHRFEDCSQMVYADGHLAAVLPAHAVQSQIHSHQGLTYGGFVVSRGMTTPLMLDVFSVVIDDMRRRCFTAAVYKTIPHIYHRMPAEEDRYALFRANAVLYRRDLLSAIDMARRPVPQDRRRRSAAKAMRSGIDASESDDWSGYWALLETHLQGRYGVLPVHSLDEIRLLHARFPHNIRLFVATLKGALVGGAVIYETHEVAHLQYAAANSDGFALGALDHLFFHLLNDVFATKRWFDFGNSTEQQGRWLNDGLVEHKEGFGARAVAHDYYRFTV